MNNERLSFYINKKIVYVNIEWTNNKNMYLKVKGDAIVVSANKRTRLKTLQKFVEEHINDFSKYLEEKKENALFSLQKGTIWIGGILNKIVILTGFTNPKAVHKNKSLYLNLTDGNDVEVTKLIKEFLKSYLFKKITIMQPLLQKRMDIAEHTFSIRYKTSTWGSNSLSTRNISYSSRLSHYNDETIEYVVIHELAHFKVPNHSSKFWDEVSKFQPDYKDIRKQLRENKTPTN